MSDPRSELASRYRRLLFLYPRSYRRHRGDEIVTTLVDAAPPHQTRPTRAEAMDLVAKGLRHRFRVIGWGARLAACVAAVFVAVAGAAAGGFLGWQSAPALPNDATVARLTDPVTTAGRVEGSRRWDFTFAGNPQFSSSWNSVLFGTDEYEAGQVSQGIYLPRMDTYAQATDSLAAVRDRLQAANWSTSDTTSACCRQFGDFPGFVAYRDGLRGEVTLLAQPTDFKPDELMMYVALTRTTPGLVPALTVMGAVIGGLVGWLMIAWASRRARESTPGRQAAAIVMFVLTVVALLPATTVSAGAIIDVFRYLHDPVPGWIGYTLLGARALSWAGLLAASAALLIVGGASARQGVSPRTAQTLTPGLS
jgi:hypothetical protein